MTIREILHRRDSALAHLESLRQEQIANAQGSLSDDGNQTVSVNIPPPAAILSIVSWNVQTFEAGKSLSNPFVNVVINRVLEELSADICILLETRAESYINMNAIETGDVGSGTWKAVEADDEDDGQDEPEERDDDGADQFTGESLMDSIGEHNDDDPDTGPDGDTAPMEFDGGEDLRYVQIVSEMTGKRWCPPSRVYVYQPAMVERARLIADFAKFDALLKKLEEVTGKSAKRIRKLAAAATRLKRSDGLSLVQDYVAGHKVPKKKGQKGRQKTFTRKDTKALLRVYSAYLKDTARFDPVRDSSDALKKFAELYHQSPKWLKQWTVQHPETPSEQWKTLLVSEELGPIRLYYDLLVVDDSFQEHIADWDDLGKAGADDNWRYVLHLRRCPGCSRPLGSGECSQLVHPQSNLTCEDVGALTVPLKVLRDSINVITFYRGAAQESYSLLVRQSTTVSGPSSGGTWLNGKRVQVGTVSSNLLMREPHVKQVAQGQKIPAYKAGRVLGYQDGSSKFYGRCPFHVPLALWLQFTGTEERLPLIAFHGPYGSDKLDGVRARFDSMNELMKAAVGDGGTSLEDSPNALIMGDFNLDWLGGVDGDSKQNIAQALYEGFATRGFKPMIEGGVATSLRSIHGQEEKWRQIDPSSSSNFTSSAYDNLFLKGEFVQHHHLHSVVIDVIAWIEENLDDFALDAEQDPPLGFDQLPPRLRAFYIYHRYVSDHLPILCDLVVQGMPDDSVAAQKANALRDGIREALRQQRVAFDYNVVMSYEAVLDVSPAFDEPDSYTKTDEDPGRYARVVGTVVGHQDDHLVICCTPLAGHAIWLTYLPELKGKPISGNVLRQFLRFHEPGTRVVVDVLNPAWVSFD